MAVTWCLAFTAQCSLFDRFQIHQRHVRSGYRTYSWAMKRLVLALIFALAGCSGAIEGTTADWTGDSRYLIVREDGAREDMSHRYLTLSEPTWEDASSPDLIFWTFADDPAFNVGDWVTVIEPDESCEDSLPSGCYARTARTESHAGSEAAIFGPYNGDRGGTEAELAFFVGTVVVNAGEPFPVEQSGGAGSHAVVIETDGSDLAGHPDLPDTDRPIVVAGSDEQVDALTEQLLEMGYSLIIAYAN